MRLAVEKADASRQANPRRRLHPRDMDLDYRNLRDLERLTFHVQDVTQVLSDVIWAGDNPFVIPDADAAPLGDAMASVGDVLRAMEEEQPERQAELVDSAGAAINQLTNELAAQHRSTDAPSAVESILVSLHRMLRLAKPGPEARQASASDAGSAA